MKTRYYYLVSGLPELKTRGRKAEHHLESIQELILENLNEDDRRFFNFLVYRNDNKNLLYILRQHDGIRETTRLTFHRPSAFSHQHLEEGLAGLVALPAYMRQFLDERREGRMHTNGRRPENRLKELYYEEALALSNEFIREYFYFKRDLKNIVCALNARRFGYAVQEVLIGSYELTEQLIGNPSADFGLSRSHPYIGELIACIDERRFRDLERAMDRILEEHLDEITAFEYFGAERVFAYFIKLSLSQRWLDIKRDAGLRELEVIIDNVLRTATLPREAEPARSAASPPDEPVPTDESEERVPA